MTDVAVEAGVRGEDVVLRLVGEIDLANAGELDRRFRAEEARTGRTLALDLRDVTYLDSAGVRLLFDTAERQRVRRHELVVVVRPETQLESVVRMVSLERVAVVADDLETGFAQVRPGARSGPGRPGA